MGFYKRTIRDVPLQHQTVLLRADYNVPLTPAGKIKDDFRIRASLPTIEYLLDKGCRVVIMSHLGRPEGRDAKLSLASVAKRLAKLLGRPVQFIDDCIGDKVVQGVKRGGQVILLENLRYYPEEEADDHAFAQKIATASGARYFVQDGFGVVHRAHASTHAITLCLPSVAGLLVEREYQTITAAMKKPKRPLVAVLGGAKVSDKIKLIEKFITVADKLVIGGAMANTFLAYKGFGMGKSIVEPYQTEVLDTIYRAAKKKAGDKISEFIILPTDVAVGPSTTPAAHRRNVGLDEIGPEDMVLDIGDQSIEALANLIKDAKTVIWNGTVGYAELPAFAHGSARLALTLATHPDVASIIGGGDTADFVLQWDGGTGADFTHISTGGGASLELMAGDKLPGIESLLDAPK